MSISQTSPPALPTAIGSGQDPLRRAVAAHLARYTGATRVHTDSDLRAFLTWCLQRQLDPLSATRVHVELYIRWMQEVRRYAPATISRRVSVVAGFYRTAVIDGLLPASPAEHVRRPHVPPESPTLRLSHLQFEAMLHTARTSDNINDFALVVLLGLLGLRIFEACGANVEDLREEHGHRVLKVRGKGGKVVLVPLPPAAQRALERSIDNRTTGPVLLNRRGVRMDRHAATADATQWNNMLLTMWTLTWSIAVVFGIAVGASGDPPEWLGSVLVTLLSINLPLTLLLILAAPKESPPPKGAAQ
ncbi:tyrosine-type recombinase/integrase [Ornithinimicrobium panacihumi]|uniref:tyrosine-type recombinase/integrase n=1 Tax=Ornithinimicrobium panacihumi TaxID=2008449 RepID=UPI003F8B800F